LPKYRLDSVLLYIAAIIFAPLLHPPIRFIGAIWGPNWDSSFPLAARLL
jgi:hypothetical protein